MYPTLTDFFYDVFGVKIPLPIQTYGFFVALAFISGIIFLSFELKRKEKEGLFSAIIKKILIGEPAKISAIVLSAIGGFLVGYKLVEAILHYSDLVKNPQEFILSARGSFIGGILVAALSGFLTWREKDRQKLDKPKWVDKTMYPHEMAGNILIIAAIFGLLGAKLFHNLENIDELIEDPIGSLFSFSGLTFLGGLIVGVVAVVWYGRRIGIPSLHLMDAAGPGLALSYGVGRLGCQVSGDGCWGITNTAPKPDWMGFLPDWLWAYDYPHNVNNIGGRMIENCTLSHCHALDLPVFPTPLYETLMMLVIFGVLWSIRKKLKTPGIMFMTFITLAGFERFLIERIRVNNEYNIFGFGITQAQIISSIMIIAGIAGIIIFRRKGHQINEWLNKKMNLQNTQQPN
jgi:prolipoprotein diacylglyceryltransferase